MRKVLFVDAEPHIQQLCQEELREEGYEVQVAGSGGDSVRLADSFHPDVVILEVLFPDWKPAELLKERAEKLKLSCFPTLSRPIS
jgi:DNA-binding response OmpR family regulator